ncbi:hypothetical protein GCM10009855_37140 [Gordonia cholesterolivorans]|uniref:Terminase n=1 Tax=Gordonia cholesterolivorans TaxID=559625 RepID=A0ABP5V8Y1_9ACTN
MRLGWGFDRWQDDVGRLTLAKLANGEYASDTIVLSIPRQVGKTYLVACIIFALCLIHPKLTVIWTAHRKTTAAETFRQFDGMAQKPKVAAHVQQVLRGKGDEKIVFNNGSRILFGARESGFGRGMTNVGILVLDEGQILPESTLEDMGATQNVAVNPLTFVMGTPPRPRDDGEFFSLLRQEAIDGESDGTLYVEFSADRGCDPMDRDQWRKANPSFPRRTSERALLRLRKKLKSDDSWNREALGIWDEASQAIVSPRRWAELVDAGPDQGVAPDSLGIAAHDGLFSVVACWADGDDRHVEEVFAHPRLDLVAEWVAGRASRRMTVFVSNYGAAAPLVPMLQAKRLTVRPASTGDVGRGCELLVEGCEAKWLTHEDQPQLADSLAGARKKLGRDGAVWTFDLKNSIHNAPAMATALALAGAANARPRRTTRQGRRAIIS